MHVTLKPHWVTVLYHTNSFIFADTVNHVFTRKMVLLGCNKHEGTFTGHDCCQWSSTEIVWEYLFLVTIMYEFFCNCSSVVQYAEPSYLSSVGLKSFFCEDKLNARYNTKSLMGRSNKIWLYLLGLLLFQWRAILNPFNCSYFKCNQQTNRHMFACIAILGKSCFSLELIVVISCYLSNKRWLSKSSRSVLLQLQYTAIWFVLSCSCCNVLYPRNKCELHLATSRILFLLWSQEECCQQCPWRHLVVLARKLFGFVCPGQVWSPF